MLSISVNKSYFTLKLFSGNRMSLDTVTLSSLLPTLIEGAVFAVNIVITRCCMTAREVSGDYFSIAEGERS